MARQILLLLTAIVLALVVLAVLLAVFDARRDARDGAAERSMNVALTVADSPAVLDALAGPDPTSRLQPFAEKVRVDTGVDFVVVMGLDRTRYTHPNPERIGQPFIGDLGDAPRGGVLTQEYEGTLGPSMRAVVPVQDDRQDVVGLVAVGITLERIDTQLRRDLLIVGLAGTTLLLLGTLGAALVGRRLRAATHGLGEREITRMYEYHQAVLHAVREGLILLDVDDRIELVNDEARRLLDLPDDVVGRRLDSLGLAPGLVAAAQADQPGTDDIYATGEHMVVVSSSPARWQGRSMGAVITLRDHTELQELTGELDVVRGLTDSLRAQQHESANRLHTVVSLIETGRSAEAVDFATGELRVAQALTDQVVASVGHPVLGALLLAKLAAAAESGIDLVVTGDVPDGLPHVSRDLVTIVGNLVDNAMEASATAVVARVACHLSSTPDGVRVVVEDSGPGVGETEIDELVQLGWTTKVSDPTSAHGGARRGIGLALVAQTLRRRGGQIHLSASPLGGAAFEVVLPVGDPARATP